VVPDDEELGDVMEEDDLKRNYIHTLKTYFHLDP